MAVERMIRSWRSYASPSQNELAQAYAMWQSDTFACLNKMLKVVKQEFAWGHRLNGGIAISCFDGAQSLNVNAVGASGDECTTNLKVVRCNIITPLWETRVFCGLCAVDKKIIESTQGE